MFREGWYLPDIVFSKELELGNGEKTVEIHLPYDIGDIICIEGINLVPHNPELFGDLSVHPNSYGFDYYKNLYNELKKYL